MKIGDRYFVTRYGQRVEVEVTHVDSGKPKPRRRDKFKTDFVKFPETWREALCGSPGAAYELAHAILVEAYVREYLGGEVKLSAMNMPRASRKRAAERLASLGLIKLSREGCQSHLVTLILPNGFSLIGK